jgi:hypothetical protein
MCISAGAAALISLAGSAIGAVGAYQQQQAAAASARNQANYQAAISRNNAIIAQQNADDIRDRANAAKADHRRAIGQTKGTARAVQASNGFLVDDTEDSTNVQAVADLAGAGELDILRLRDNMEREIRVANIKGDQFTAEAGLFDLQGASVQGGSLLSAAASVAGGAGAAYKISRS